MTTNKTKSFVLASAVLAATAMDSMSAPQLRGGNQNVGARPQGNVQRQAPMAPRQTTVVHTPQGNVYNTVASSPRAPAYNNNVTRAPVESQNNRFDGAANGYTHSTTFNGGSQHADGNRFNGGEVRNQGGYINGARIVDHNELIRGGIGFRVGTEVWFGGCGYWPLYCNNAWGVPYLYGYEPVVIVQQPAPIVMASTPTWSHQVFPEAAPAPRYARQPIPQQAPIVQAAPTMLRSDDTDFDANMSRYIHDHFTKYLKYVAIAGAIAAAALVGYKIGARKRKKAQATAGSEVAAEQGSQVPPPMYARR